MSSDRYPSGCLPVSLCWPYAYQHQNPTALAVRQFTLYRQRPSPETNARLTKQSSITHTVKHQYAWGVLFAVLVVALPLVVITVNNGSTTDGIDAFPTTDQTYDTNATMTAPSETPAFTFTIDEITDCGETCRDVTATLENKQQQSATDVTIHTRIFAGADTTASAAQVWETTEEIGTIAPTGQHTTTKRVNLSIRDALQIDQEGGQVTIVTTVQTATTTTSFKDNRQVA